MKKHSNLVMFLVMLMLSTIPPIVATFTRTPTSESPVSSNGAEKSTLTESDRTLRVASSRPEISKDEQSSGEEEAQSSKAQTQKKISMNGNKPSVSNDKASTNSNKTSASNSKTSVNSDQRSSVSNNESPDGSGEKAVSTDNAATKNISGNRAKKTAKTTESGKSAKTSEAAKSSNSARTAKSTKTNKKSKAESQVVKTSARNFISDLAGDTSALIANAIYTPTDLPSVAMVNALCEGSEFTDDGDEQSFVCVLDDQGRRTKKLEAGKEYQIHIFVHSIVAPKARQQYAENVAVLLREFPNGVMHAGGRRSLETYILWGGVFSSYRSCRYELQAEEDLVVELDPIDYPNAASAKYVTAGKANGKKLLVDELVGYVEGMGCRVGYDKLNGILPCGDEYAGEVEISFRTSRLETTQKAASSSTESSPNAASDKETLENEVTPVEVSAKKSEQLAQAAVSAASIAVTSSSKSNQADYFKGLVAGLSVALLALGVLLLIALGLLVHTSYQNHADRESISEAPSTPDSAYVDMLEYQQKIADAADTVVAGALFLAEHDMKFFPEKANLCREIHKLILQAVSRIIRREERQREYMLLMNAMEELQQDSRTVLDAHYSVLHDQPNSSSSMHD